MRLVASRLPARWIGMIVLSFLVTGCGILGSKPTPLPWIPTETPLSTIGSQSAPSATPTEAAPTQSTTPALSGATPASTPTTSPSPTPSPTTTEQMITLDMPAQGQTMENPIRLLGRAALMPFEGTLVIRVIDSAGQIAAERPIIAEGEIGGPATFEATVTYGGIPGPGRVEVLDISAKDGSVIARATTQVTLSGFAGGGYIEQPAPRAGVTLPIKLLARVGTPGQDVNVTVAWADGAQFSHVFTTLAGLDGRGLLVVPLDIVGTGFGHPATQNGEIQIHTIEGSPLAWQPVHILAPDDPATMSTRVYWVVSERITAQQIRIPRTAGIGKASLEALLWGPVPQNSQGYTTMIPGPAQVLAYPGRSSDWGERPQLGSLTIKDGIAYADFSLELGAHAGGALVTSLIREQIEATLAQFSTVDKVVISINGVTGVLEP